jgi:hypothetical protein
LLQVPQSVLSVVQQTQPSAPAASILPPAAPPAGLQMEQRRTYSAATEAHFQTKQYKLHKLDTGPSNDVTLKRDDALKYYRQMQLIRRMETAAGNLYKEKKVRGFCHLYSGQVNSISSARMLCSYCVEASAFCIRIVC